MDASGKLDFEEFLRLMIYEKKIFLKQYFDDADATGKGWLTKDEVVKALADAGYKITNAREEGEDGKIDFKEFLMNLSV